MTLEASGIEDLEATMAPFAPRRILAATDFTEVSNWALRYAAKWAQQYQAELTVLHVEELLPVGTDPYFGSFGLARLDELAREAISQQVAATVARDVPAGVQVDWDVVAGPPAASIEEVAASTHADLVVLGTHGRGGVTRFLLGSVAERELRLAHHPTLIVHEPVAAKQNGSSVKSEPPAPRLRHILCPVNYTEVARAAFEHACAIAQSFGATLTVVFAVEPNEGYLHAGGLRDAEERLRAWLPIEAAADCQMQPIVRRGNASEQVITLAHEADVDLIVVGAQHRSFVDTTVLGGTTVRVTRHAPCPVLVVPQLEQREREPSGAITCAGRAVFA
jgi:nucleotide-binding universal stress UspA family protein